jgi:hypothetical protein
VTNADIDYIEAELRAMRPKLAPWPPRSGHAFNAYTRLETLRTVAPPAPDPTLLFSDDFAGPAGVPVTADSRPDHAAAQKDDAAEMMAMSGSVQPPRTNLKGYSLSVTVEDGYYLKAYANPPEGSGNIISYGFQATISRKGVRDSLRQLVDDFLEDNLDA